MTSPLPRLSLAMDPERTQHVLTPQALERLSQSVDIIDISRICDFHNPSVKDQLERTDILLTGWGCPDIGARELALMPRLKLISHAAGTVKYFLSQAVFERGITVCSAAEANAQPVAEFTQAMILLAGKRVFSFRRLYGNDRGRENVDRLQSQAIGNLGRTVGVVGASRIGRRVINLLKPFDLDIILFDPFLSAAEAERLGVRLVALDALMAISDVISLHAPSLPQTRHMIGAEALARMKDGATLINTARGALVDEEALLAELKTGRIEAVIDVTDPEVPPPDSAFYSLPNVFLTPHIAGAVGLERARLGDMAIAEIERFCQGAALEQQVRPEHLELIA
ncbi:Hydroxypyruvate reductase [Rhizobium rhizogenes]|uniref:Hydroxypyruvate reductase n=1 Tax=Rhizobium rhizogenes TaxID=359 RepID=A0AAN2DE81_RHIRH|nr:MULTISPECIES: hydroxyacid dehydrogenase [Rhizobium/Agrobacterium group]AQS65067.1 hydroxyacid dehydrogenase [Rhizobium rhizogenes]MCZ7444658.1 hydroxyacid dehydrogenase [Rhizobium rhizogenes]NSZ80495.1 hydroxyacid dehydrogenase [Agrobacterium tumefaciens]OAM63319.1 hydroxyacid dehydrogenase [Rhizobium rhizogenes]CAD0214791.1 Hydroxypyruvate reductase [Rhizobium rhizogenes]